MNESRQKRVNDQDNFENEHPFPVSVELLEMI